MAISRKSQARQQLMLLLLVFALIFALIILTKGIAGVFIKVSDVELCKASTTLASAQYEYEKFGIPIFKADSPIKSKCKTEFIELKDEVPLKDYDRELSGVEDKDREILKRFIFEKLALCWYQFGEGKVEVYNADQREDSACAVCSKIVPGEKFKELYSNGVRLDNLYEYAENEEYAEGVNYLTYLTGFPDEKFTTSISGGQITLGDKPYFIVFQVNSEGKYTVNCNVGSSGRAIRHCSVAGKGQKTDCPAKKIGCDGNGHTEGVNFGRGVKEGILTVRAVPASGITEQNCGRLV